MSKKTLAIVLCTSALVGASSSARAEHCRWRYDQAFTALQSRNLRTLERGAKPDEFLSRAEAEVNLLFGPPVAQCEEGAYSLFLERYEGFTKAALRMKGAERDTRLRVAIAVIRRGPDVVDYAEQSKEVSRYDQMLSNLGVIAADAGNTPLMQQLINAIKAKGPPKATRRADTAKPDPHVTQVYVPTVPLPGWAVISLYEIADHAQRQEHDRIQGKVEAILTWMKSVTPATPSAPGAPAPAR